MLYSMYILRDAMVRLKNISQNIDAQLEKPKANFKEDAVMANAMAALADVQTALCEGYSVGIYALRKGSCIRQSAQTIIPVLLEMTELRPFNMMLKTLLNDMDDFNYDEPSANWMSSYYIQYGTRIRTDYDGILYRNSAAKAFARCLQTQVRPLKVFDMQTRSGYAGESIKERLGGNVELYGADVNSEIFDGNRGHYHRLISGELKGIRVRITPNAFDAVYLDPSISWERPDAALAAVSGGSGRDEQVALIKATGYLREDGVLGFVIPRFRIHRDTAMYLATHYADIQIFTSTDDLDGTSNGQTVLIMGKKRVGDANNRLQPNTRYYHMLRDLCSMSGLPEEIIYAEDALHSYNLPYGAVEIENFRGAKLSDEDADFMMRQSMAATNFWKDQTPQSNEAKPKHPLLPFSVGQLGLVLTSGVLDGIVDEGNGHYHVVRGRVKKHRTEPKDEEKTMPDGKTKVERTIVTSNVVELSVIGPDGSYKRLAG